jgi:hypothetical protein
VVFSPFVPPAEVDGGVREPGAVGVVVGELLGDVAGDVECGLGAVVGGCVVGA